MHTFAYLRYCWITLAYLHNLRVARARNKTLRIQWTDALARQARDFINHVTESFHSNNKHWSYPLIDNDHSCDRNMAQQRINGTTAPETDDKCGARCGCCSLAFAVCRIMIYRVSNYVSNFALSLCYVIEVVNGVSVYNRLPILISFRFARVGIVSVSAVVLSFN